MRVKVKVKVTVEVKMKGNACQGFYIIIRVVSGMMAIAAEY